MNRKTLWNPLGDDALDETLIGANPTGMLDMNRSRYKWAKSLYDQMEANTWFSQEVSTNGEKQAYMSLSKEEQRAYDLVFAQLSFNDSLQAENLIDNINGYITNKMVNACIARQGWEEINHSKSYAVLLADTVEDNSEIFDLYRNDLTLRAKNDIIARNYAELTVGEVTKEKFFYACIANQLLEGVYFLAGFAVIYYLGDKMKASATMISFIHRDENTHLALFSNIIRTFIAENPDEAYFMWRPKVNKMFDDAYKLEVSWLKYIGKGLFSDELCEQTVAYFIRDRARLIGMYDEDEDKYHFGTKTPLVLALERGGDFNGQKTNFFEGAVKNYSMGTLDNWDEDDIDDYGTPQPTYKEAIKALGK